MLITSFFDTYYVSPIFIGTLELAKGVSTVPFPGSAEMLLIKIGRTYLYVTWLLIAIPPTTLRA